jgi:16S rRNA (cytosine1402-N4)-methyltransferase
MDRDPVAVEGVRARLASFGCAEVVHANYSSLPNVLRDMGIESVDGVLIDAGMSSTQLDNPERGFTFQQEGPLDMRQDTTQPMTAKAYLETVGETELAQALRKFADVKPAQRIAKAIIMRRTKNAMNTTLDLRDAVSEALPFLKGQPEEVRTVFQAIRIAVNDEYRHLEIGVRAGIAALADEGRIVVISFHSGEDRIVKNVLREESRARREYAPDGRVITTTPPTIRVLTAKPISADADEVFRNPRAQSAKLRAAERLIGEKAA